ncbi:MAG: ATP synthase F1 subunit gamma [Candidatus Kerfeldbacteria bacterium]|nr:ATP synthase F1 subunit gamma [Candidatus Kerfeldbacteria bacterium]
MPQATREIKRRIRSIKNTRQITRAMELVSAAKMRRAVQNVLATRTYAALGWQLLQELSQRTSPAHHPLLVKRDKVKRLGLVLISSNRGLCGGFNYQISHRADNYIKQQVAPPEVGLIALGKRGRDIMLRSGYTLAAEFTKPDVTTKIEEVRAMAKLVIDDYMLGRYDRVVVAYTDFISAVSQKPRLKQLLPLEQESDSFLGRTGSPLARVAGSESRAAPFNYEYKFEPTPDIVLEDLLPRLTEVQVYQALLESDASEHSARMFAMRNASDAARDMIDSLTLSFNQARQASITAELADITGGRVAIGG